MLPGLEIRGPLPFHLCLNIKRIIDDVKKNTIHDLESYITHECLSECHIEIKINYIKTLDEQDCKQFLNEEESRIRLEALNKIYDERILKRFVKDPCKEIRKNIIQRLPCSMIFLEHTYELCPYIRLKAFEKLTEKKFLRCLNKIHLNMVFDRVCEMINDINLSVRIKAADSLKNFKQIEEKKIVELLSKKDINENITPGSFVHGFEDENELVRCNTVESICTLTKTDNMANITFDFLVDVLNDEIEAVKVKSSIWMHKIVEKFKINVKNEMLDLLFCNFEEKNNEIKSNLYMIIPLLNFDNTSLSYCISKIQHLLCKNVEQEKLYKCLREIVIKNHDYFSNNYEMLHKSFFEEQIILNDPIFFSNLIVIAELIKLGKKFDLPNNFDKYLLYYKLKEAVFCGDKTKDDAINIEGLDHVQKKTRMNDTNDTFLKSFLLEFATNIEKRKLSLSKLIDKYKNIFSPKFGIDKFSKFYCDFFNAMVTFYLNNDDKELKKLFILSNIKYNTISTPSLIKIMKETDKICSNHIYFATSNKVIRKFYLPLQIEASIGNNDNIDDIFLKIVGSDGNESIYKIFEKTKAIFYDEKSTELSLSIVKKINDSFIVISDIKKVAVETQNF